MEQPKVYRAVARLDVTSDSFDADRPLLPVAVAAPPSSEAVREACKTFEGLIDQTPPAISAVKVGGVPAYRRALRGEMPALAARPVRIYWLHVQAYEWPELRLDLCCGRGTYVRSLVRDLGQHLRTGGCLMSLRRSRVGPFAEEQAWSFEALGSASSGEFLIGLAEARPLLDSANTVIPPRPGAREA